MIIKFDSGSNISHESHGAAVSLSKYPPAVCSPFSWCHQVLDEGGEWHRPVAQREAHGDLRTRRKEGHLLLDPGHHGVAEVGGCGVSRKRPEHCLGWFPRRDSPGLERRLPRLLARGAPEVSTGAVAATGGEQPSVSRWGWPPLHAPFPLGQSRGTGFLWL